jgi:uncharacterized membrane protein YeaQ/YmgE (transglycosylase-associated protein family)
MHECYRADRDICHDSRNRHRRRHSFRPAAGPSWLTRQFTGSTRGIVTSALVGIAGAFVGYHIAVLLALGGGLLMPVIASAAGAAVVLFAWRLAK